MVVSDFLPLCHYLLCQILFLLLLLLIPDPSLNDWKKYYLSFIEHKTYEYTRIYHLDSLFVDIHTCENNCYSCWDGYDKCTNCNNGSFAVLSDRRFECFPRTYLVERYIYDSSENMFLECYESCEFCTESSSSASDQKCSSCLQGYLYSYTKLGNCYLYTDLYINGDKEVDETKNIFIASTCLNYKIASTGECVDACPITTPYYLYEYSELTQRYGKVYFNLPRYILNNLCLEKCPENYSPNENNECICYNFYYQDSEGNIVCFPDDNCSEEYPYLNQDTKECFSSLEDCNFFFC